jgi:hypothetical protein
MKQDLISFAIRALFVFAVAAALACISANTLLAQGNKGRDFTLREHQMTELEREKTRKREPAELLTEVNEDMGRLKALNQELSLQAAATDQQLNYKTTLDSLDEINKRATRLGSDLALPPPDKDEKRNAVKDVGKGALQPSLLELNKLLDGFLNNPIFVDTGAVDMHLAAKAKGDLDDIISLSAKLRKATDKRIKDGGKTP